MRKTKIVCTIGPVSSNKKILGQLVKAGLNVARLNFSHGQREDKSKVIDLIKEVEEEMQQAIGIMIDLKGPEIRTGMLKKEPVELKTGAEIILSIEEILGDSKKISVSYKDLPLDLSKGSKILIDDGLIELKVLEIGLKEIRCKIVNGGLLSSQKGVNLPGIKLNLPALTDNDKEDIKFGVKKGVHFIAASFVRKGQDVIAIKNLLKELQAEKLKVIAKIESQEGVENIEEIIKHADGIMVARGDLGVEMPPEKVPIIQKLIINKCNEAAKPVIIATQMLESMIRNPRPTRAEASDAANAIFDGTDATMLSGETAIGKYPVESVKNMSRIVEEAERSISYREKLHQRKRPVNTTVTDAIGFASCETATDLQVKAIISSTGSGLTARMVSKYRPLTLIVAVTPDIIVQHTLTLYWGVYPLLVKESKTTDEMISNSISVVKENNLVKDGDLVIITAGVPVGTPGTTNLIEVDTVGKR